MTFLILDERIVCVELELVENPNCDVHPNFLFVTPNKRKCLAGQGKTQVMLCGRVEVVCPAFTTGRVSDEDDNGRLLPHRLQNEKLDCKCQGLLDRGRNEVTSRKGHETSLMFTVVLFSATRINLTFPSKMGQSFSWVRTICNSRSWSRIKKASTRRRGYFWGPSWKPSWGGEMWRFKVWNSYRTRLQTGQFLGGACLGRQKGQVVCVVQVVEGRPRRSRIPVQSLSGRHFRSRRRHPPARGEPSKFGRSRVFEDHFVRRKAPQKQRFILSEPYS